MNIHITSILDEARRAPSVLNTQPWRFRVCGNTIEVYLEKKKELVEIDPAGRLQIASCGTLIAHLENAVLKNGWIPKVTFFPRFEEPDLVAFVELNDPLKRGRKASRVETTQNIPAVKQDHLDGRDAANMQFLQGKLTELAAKKDVLLVMHNDCSDNSIQTYLKNQCGEKLKSEYFKRSVNLFLRTDQTEDTVPFEDEALLSDRFFDAVSSSGGKNSETGEGGKNPPENLFMILATGTDNRYEWTRSGQVLGEIIIELRNWDNIGLMALPIISKDVCRNWLKKKLELSGYPQFVLKMEPVKPREHIGKRPLSAILKYGIS